MSAVTEAQVIDRLDTVLDPCSCMTDTPMSIVELGIVEEVFIDGHHVEIALVPTTPFCLYMAKIRDEIQAEVSTLARVEEVQVETILDELWVPERMTAPVHASRVAVDE